IRFPVDAPIVDLARVADLLRDPGGTLRTAYAGPGPVVSADLARQLFPQLDEFADALGHALVLPFDPDVTSVGQVGAAGQELAAASAVLFFPAGPDAAATDSGVGAVLTISAA